MEGSVIGIKIFVKHPANSFMHLKIGIAERWDSRLYVMKWSLQYYRTHFRLLNHPTGNSYSNQVN